MLFATSVLPQSAAFQANAPAGTGLEWMTVAAVLVPAVLLVGLVYWSAVETA